MRKTLKRLIALTAALSMSMSLIFTATAAGPDPVRIDMSGSSITVEDGKHQIKVKAKLELSDDFIAAASAGNIDDGTGKSKLLDLRFECILKGNLLKKYDALELNDFTFTGDNADSFELVDTDKSQNSVTLTYKLNDEINWLYEPAVGDLLDGVLTVETADSDKFVVEKGVLSAGNTTLTARVDIRYADGQDIPGYDKEVIKGAEGTIKLNVPTIPGGGSSGGSGGSGSSGGSGGGGGVETPEEPLPEQPSEPLPEQPSEPLPEQPSEPLPEQPSEPLPEQPVEPLPEQPVEPLPKHEVKVENNSPKGEANVENENASAGDKVTVNVDNLANGHRVTQVIITTQAGEQITVDRKDSLTYEFEMPAEEVTVEVVYGPSATRPEDSGVSEKLNADDHIAFMVGDDKGHFRPNSNITRAEVAQIFYALLRDKNIDITASFVDIDPNAWYAKAVYTIASLGAVKGVGNDMFDPNRPITRAEFATIAANFAAMSHDQFNFDDVAESHWGYSFISSASNYGWVAGVGANIFQPNRSITRAEAATIVNNMLGRIGDTDEIDAGHGRYFPDVDQSHWGWYEINEAANAHGHSFDEEFIEETWHN